MAYIHESNIKHKDLKPSNILLSKNGLWLTDFGIATDFSVLTTSGTDNGERGTPKYFAPEVARFEPSGRAADIFSMGCIFFEIMILCFGHTLDLSTKPRHLDDKSFQSNLDNVNAWLTEEDWSEPKDPRSIDHYLLGMISTMVEAEADKRPTAGMVNWDVAMIRGLCSAYRSMRALSQGPGIYRACCYQEMFPIQCREMQPMPGTEVTVKITIGRTYFLPPYVDGCSSYIESMDEDFIEAVQMFTVSISEDSF